MLRGVSWVVVLPAGGSHVLALMLELETASTRSKREACGTEGFGEFFIFNFVLPWATMSGGNGSDNSSGSTNTARYQNMGGERERKRKKFFFCSELREGKGG